MILHKVLLQPRHCTRISSIPQLIDRASIHSCTWAFSIGMDSPVMGAWSIQECPTHHFDINRDGCSWTSNGLLIDKDFKNGNILPFSVPAHGSLLGSKSIRY